MANFLPTMPFKLTSGPFGNGWGLFLSHFASTDARSRTSLKPGSVSNGSITVGGIDDRLYTGSIAYTPNTGGGQFYQMGAQGITVGGASVVLDEPNVIIDSGTNILLLPSESYTSLKQVFLALCSSVNLHGVCDVPSGSTIFDNVCYPFTPAQVAGEKQAGEWAFLPCIHTHSNSVSQHHALGPQHQPRADTRALHSVRVWRQLQARSVVPGRVPDRPWRPLHQ